MSSLFRAPDTTPQHPTPPPPPPSPTDPNSGAQAAINAAQADEQNRARGRAATLLSDQSAGSPLTSGQTPSARNVLLGS